MTISHMAVWLYLKWLYGCASYGSMAVPHKAIPCMAVYIPHMAIYLIWLPRSNNVWQFGEGEGVRIGLSETEVIVRCGQIHYHEFGSLVWREQDGVAPLMTDPPPTSFNKIIKKNVTCDKSHVTCDMCHMTYDT